ncbi:rab-like protein 3 [Paramacrobiotus metropolitanus]|uniref:rab-like protein 3 n=1 Tax=Paramacrobiotus metropolitanus TaxID=2943436 RepID=UPI0024464793|nr:rab-like protein 3 [Paramacrobiotus metropolitanus]
MSVDNARVLVVGDVAVGKTSLIRYLSQRKAVNDPPPPTVGCELEVLVRITLCSCPHKFVGIILVYDSTSPRSCQRLLYWRQEIHKYSYEKQDVPDGAFPYSRVPDGVVTGDDRRQSTTRRTSVPVLIVGTKADQTSTITPEHRGWIDKVLNDYSASEIRVSSNRPSDLSPGTKNFEVFRSFMNKVIETKFYGSIPSPHILPVSPTMRPRARSFNTKNRSAAM